MTKFFGLRLTKRNKPCYLDANFLIAYFIPGHEFYDRSRRLMFSLLKARQKMLISCLAFDETLYKIKREKERLTPDNQKRPYKEYADVFDRVLNEIGKLSLIRIIQFQKDLGQSLKDVLYNIRTYNLKPRDAFHYAYMKEYGINKIVTNDGDFAKCIPGIEVVSF